MVIPIPTLLFLILIVGGIFGVIYFLISQFASSPIDRAIAELQKEEKYKDIIKKNISSDERFFSAISYIGPFFIFTMVLKQDSDFCRFHVKQAIFIFFLFIFFSFLYFFISFLLPIFAGFFRFIFSMIIVFYMFFGIITASLGEKKPLPIISDYVNLN